MSSNNNEGQLDSEYEKLKNSKFKQQKLPAWRPVPTITSTTATFIIFGLIFITIGVIILIYSNKIVELSIPYDTECLAIGKCKISLNVTQVMEAPIMVYYQLNNFYQNHRRYVKSKSNSQLNGQVISLPDLTSSNDCDPIYSVADLGNNKTVSGQILPANSPANPCGLIAKSLFNDKYTINYMNGTNIFINETNIAWEADKELKYKRPVDPTGQDPDYWKKIQWTDVLDEHFMVWMRPAGLPNFRKLWGRINTTLDVGTYSLEIDNNFEVKPFNGQKFFVLSTVNSLGGKNSFLGISYLVVGAVCIIMAIAFVIGYNIHKSKKED
jgi:hypothetical protein